MKYLVMNNRDTFNLKSETKDAAHKVPPCKRKSQPGCGCGFRNYGVVS